MWAAPLDAASSAQHMCKDIFFTWAKWGWPGLPIDENPTVKTHALSLCDCAEYLNVATFRSSRRAATASGRRRGEARADASGAVAPGARAGGAAASAASCTTAAERKAGRGRD